MIITVVIIIMTLRILSFYFIHEFSESSNNVSGSLISWPVSVGIITPYSAQSNLINEQLERINQLFDPNIIKFVCKTVDGFQGQECDIIIFLAVRSNDRKKLGFLLDFRRLNVAITRGRYSLLVIGNCKTLGTNDTWLGLIDTAKEKGCIQTCTTSALIDRVINIYKQEDMKMIRLKLGIELFENTLWSNKLIMMHMFKETFPSIIDANKRDRIISLLLRLAEGRWPKNNSYSKGNDKYDFSKIVFLYPMGADILVWSIDLKVSCICFHIYALISIFVCIYIDMHVAECIELYVRSFMYTNLREFIDISYVKTHHHMDCSSTI
jgi:hypothetical protein